jgi:hypothetical protein
MMMVFCRGKIKMQNPFGGAKGKILVPKQKYYKRIQVSLKISPNFP